MMIATLNGFNLLPGAESPKVVHSLWANIGKELHNNPTDRNSRNGNVKKDPRSFNSHSDRSSHSLKETSRYVKSIYLFSFYTEVTETLNGRKH